MAFAASTTDEARVAAHIVRQGRSACTEGVVSAAGLSTIYAAISGETGASRPPEEITRDARSDPLAGQTLSTFVGALGSVIGDLVLAFTAWDGVFITGALARAICPALAGPELRRRMENKSTFGRKLATVPLAVVTRNDLELAGAAVALRSNWQHATP